MVKLIGRWILFFANDYLKKVWESTHPMPIMFGIYVDADIRVEFSNFNSTFESEISDNLF